MPRNILERLISVLFITCLVFSCKEEIDYQGNIIDIEEDGTIHVTGLSLNMETASIKEGESIIILPTIIPSDATNKNIMWTSGNNDVAEVEDGKVIGIKHGNTTITATTDDGGFTATCSIIVEENLAPSVTVGVKNISAISVVLMGKANLESTVSSDLQIGFQYSKSAGILPANSITIESVEADADYNYTSPVTGLEPGTKYYYRSYVRQGGMDTYGETKEFETKELSSLLQTQEASDISAVSSKLNARIDWADVLYTTREIGFYYGTDKESLTKKVIATNEEASMSAIISDLAPSKEYYYQAYALIDEREFKEDIISFTTLELVSLFAAMDPTDIDATSARLNAYLNLTNVSYSNLTYGFYIGLSNSSQKTPVYVDDYKDNVFSSSLKDLSPKTQYWYKPFLKIDNNSFYGDIKSFTTDIIAVESVSLDKTEYVFDNIGNILILTATVLPEDATDKRVKWESDDDSIATVSNGYVKATGNGKTTIRVSSIDQNKVATCDITVSQKVQEITLNQSNISLAEGQSFKLVPTILPENAVDKTITWESTDNSVASVNQDGNVTAHSKGSAYIMATANDGSGRYAFCMVTVKRMVSTITLDKTFITLYSGQSETLVATVLPDSSDDSTVTWSSSNSSVATVSSIGVVTAISSGNTTITAKANDGSGVQATCQVCVKQYVTSITLNVSSLVLYEGQKGTIIVSSIKPQDANDKTITWSSCDDSVASVNQDGEVIANTKGNTTIRATANDGSGIYAECFITVNRYVSTISFDKGYYTIYNGEQTTIVATVSPGTASDKTLTWTSSNPSVAVVSSSGVVTGISRGVSTVTAYANDESGVYKSVDVEVKQYVTGITLNKTSMRLVEKEVSSITVTSISPDNANDKTYSWISSDNNIATVDQAGKVTANNKGKATIIAISNDGGAQSTCDVIVSHPCPDEAVDLGLTTSEGYNLYWATCNISENGFVNSPDEFGDYYAWGETETYYEDGDALSTSPRWKSGKTGYNLSSYKWYNNGSYLKYNYSSTYGPVDNKYVLETGPNGDDVASKTLGNNWRMPTSEEWRQLLETCTINNIKINEKWCIEIVSTIYPQNYIIVPRSGNRVNRQLNQNNIGLYWSSSISSSKPSDACAAFLSSASNYFIDEIISREVGLTIRPVSD